MSNPHQIFVPGMGNRNASIVLLGEGPFTEEIKVLKPFVGPSGNFLDSLLAEAGIDRGQCWVTNVSKYMVPPNAKGGRQIPFPTRAQSVGIDIAQQIDWLRTELTSLPNLKVIIALGGTALWALTGKTAIQKYRGSILNGWGFKVIPTYHPAHLLHQSGEVKGFWNKPVMVHDLKRGKEESSTREFNLPHRNLQVARSSGQFYDFIQRHKNHRNPSIDIEARNCIPICVGIAFTRSEGITLPLWNVSGICNINDNDLVSLWRELSDFLSSHSVIGQNFGYDRDKIRRLGFTIGSLHSDTMLKAFALHPELPKNLGFLTSIYTREPYYKDEGMYEGSIDDLLLGCARDACVTKEIDDVLEDQLIELGTLDYYRNFVLPLHEIYFFNETFTAIEQNGFRLDHDERKRLVRKYIEMDERLKHKLFQLTGSYVNTGSPKQVAELLYEKLKLPIRQGTGEEVLTQLLNSSAKKPFQKQTIEAILEDRQVKKTLSSYLYSPTDFDGRMRTSYYICLETGRSATQQQEPPIRPQVLYKEGSVKKKQSRGMAFQTITKHGDIGSDIRRMLVADEGEIFLQADSSQAEARVIFQLAMDYEALLLMDTIDWHALTATWFFGGKVEDYDKKILGYEHPKRFGGKTIRHAGHLGAGKRRAATEINTQARKYKIDFSISEREAGLALETFHKRQPKIRGIFHAEIVKCLEKNRRLVAPVPYGIDAKVGGTRIFFERWGDELNRQAFSYIPQRTVSENTKAAAIRITGRAKWIRILVESHDALLTSQPIERAQEAALILKEEMERPIDFSTCSLERGTLTIPCDVESGYNYKDLSKFKWLVEEVA